MQAATPVQAASPAAPLSWWTRISYGLGDTACNVVMGITTAVLTLFYTDYAGVSVAVVGLAMLISRVFDGTSDVIMGVIVNKTKSKWGKARPWVLWMAVPYALCTISMFCIPQSTETVQFWYIFITYNLCTTVCYTAINVPYGTLSTLMTRSSHERDMLSVIRMALSPFGKIIAVTFTLPIVKLFGDDQAAWIKVMSIWCIIAVGLLVICFANCKETVRFEVQQQAQPKVTAGRSLKALLSNPYFWATLILWAVTCIHTTIIGTDLPYYCKYVLGNDELYSFIYTAEIIALIVGALACPFLLRRFNKRDLSLLGCVIVVAAQALIMLHPNSFSWILIMTIIRALGQALLTSVVFGMMGDVVEYGQWKSHIRQESLIFGAGSLGFKVGTGVTSAIMTMLLEGAGFLSSTTGGAVQPESAKEMIAAIFYWGPILVWAVAIVVLLLYRLDKIYSTIMTELAEREARGEM